MQVAIKRFAGELPKVTPRLLPTENAVTAENCTLERGHIEAIRKPVARQTSLSSRQTVYKLKDTYLSWDSDVDVVKAFVVSEDSRIFYTGDGAPKQTNYTLGLGGAAPLGVPVPDSPTFINPSGTPSLGDYVRTTAYVLTYVTVNGEESAPSTPSVTGDVYSNSGALVSLPEDVPFPVRADIAKIRLYRVATGNDFSDYRFVKEFTYAATYAIYEDEVEDKDLGEVLPSKDWTTPPSALKGLITFGNGMNAGFVDNKVYISEPNIPYAFPTKFIKTVDAPVIGLGHFNGNLVVFTADALYIYSGEQPELMSKEKFPENQGCVSKRSIVSTEQRVFFATPDGLFAVSGNGLENITANILTRDQWQAYSPSSICGVWYNSAYYGFVQGTGLGFSLDFLEPPYIINLDISSYGTIKHAMYDPVSDKMYILTDRNTATPPVNDHTIWEWEADQSSNLSYTWKSKLFELPMMSNMAAGRVTTSGGGVDVKMYRNGESSPHVTKTNKSGIFRLPAGFKSKTWQIEVQGSAPVVYELKFGSSINGLADA